jgi:hypothetical protein
MVSLLDAAIAFDLSFFTLKKMRLVGKGVVLDLGVVYKPCVVI